MNKYCEQFLSDLKVIVCTHARTHTLKETYTKIFGVASLQTRKT